MIEDIICIKYLNILSSYGFKGIICSPGNSSTCIDHIVTKIINSLIVFIVTFIKVILLIIIAVLPYYF